jgi:16S rRNA (uracil1498-N3)-methyltransferase
LTSNRFFVKQDNIDSSTALLENDEHIHLSKVARIKEKENVLLFDGQGTIYRARVEKIEKEKTRLKILDNVRKNPSLIKITLAQAVLKAKNMDFILQKTTEWGIAALIPVISHRSVVQIKDPEHKTERWNKIVLSAAKQSGTPFLPTVSPPQTLAELLKSRTDARRLVLTEKGGRLLKQILIEDPSSVIILTGPEGGWTDEEEQDILNHGFEAVCLGANILRAETAAVSGVAMVSHFWNT